MEKEKKMVSVLMICYNQERYIDQAIRGVLNQKTNFSIELIIGDDCSTDKTRDICLYYQERYNDRVKLLNREKNLGIVSNFIDTFNHCNGKYIAICEGDDYWFNPYKLQKQVDALEANPDCALCFHRVLNYYEADQSKSISNMRQKKLLTMYDLLNSNVITNVSVLYRNNFSNGLPAWMAEASNSDYAIDYALHITATTQGNALFIPEVMAVYRIHAKGFWSDTGIEKRYLIAMKVRELLLKRLVNYHKASDILTIAYLSNARNLLKHYQQTNNNEKAIELRKSIDSKFPLYSEKFELMLHAEPSNSVSSQLFRIVKLVRQEVSKLFPLPQIKDELI